MKLYLKLGLLSILLMNTACKNTQKDNNPQKIKTIENESSKNEGISSIYSFSVEDIDGNIFNFKDLKGKKIMIVNTASKCGLTPQYKELEQIYNKYSKANDFVIVGFPANNFASQEPGNNDQIKEFCSLNYQISFPMMSKISVKGDDMSPIYKFLTSKKENGVEDSEVEWNFQKYLIGRDGVLEKVISPKTSPKSSEIISWITTK